MRWFKKKKETESEKTEGYYTAQYLLGLIESAHRSIIRANRHERRLALKVDRLTGGGRTEAARLVTLESEMNLWNKRMRAIKNLLDGQTLSKDGEDSCCNIWKGLRFGGVEYCPKCGEFLGY